MVLLGFLYKEFQAMHLIENALYADHQTSFLDKLLMHETVTGSFEVQNA